MDRIERLWLVKVEGIEKENGGLFNIIVNSQREEGHVLKSSFDKTIKQIERLFLSLCRVDPYGLFVVIR